MKGITDLERGVPYSASPASHRSASSRAKARRAPREYNISTPRGGKPPALPSVEPLATPPPIAVGELAAKAAEAEPMVVADVGTESVDNGGDSCMRANPSHDVVPCDHSAHALVSVDHSNHGIVPVVHVHIAAQPPQIPIEEAKRLPEPPVPEQLFNREWALHEMNAVKVHAFEIGVKAGQDRSESRVLEAAQKTEDFCRSEMNAQQHAANLREQHLIAEANERADLLAARLKAEAVHDQAAITQKILSEVTSQAQLKDCKVSELWDACISERKAHENLEVQVRLRLEEAERRACRAEKEREELRATFQRELDRLAGEKEASKKAIEDFKTRSQAQEDAIALKAKRALGELESRLARLDAIDKDVKMHVAGSSSVPAVEAVTMTAVQLETSKQIVMDPKGGASSSSNPPPALSLVLRSGNAPSSQENPPPTQQTTRPERVAGGNPGGGPDPDPSSSESSESSNDDKDGGRGNPGGDGGRPPNGGDPGGQPGGNPPDPQEPESKEVRRARKRLERAKRKAEETRDRRKPRVKEADSIKVPPMPSPLQYRQWKGSIRTEVTAASGRGEEAFQWVLDAESRDVTFEELYDSKGFDSLDAKLAAALIKSANDNLGRKICLEVEKQAM